MCDELEINAATEVIGDGVVHSSNMPGRDVNIITSGEETYFL